MKNPDLADAVGVHPGTVSNWRSGEFVPEGDRIEAIVLALLARGVNITAAWLRYGEGETPAARVREPVPEYNAEGWPEGWRARTYRLQLEAAELGATEEEITIVKGWMLNPQLQALWSGGPPKDDRLKELDGIEIGARAWLRARGRQVRPR